MANRGSDKIQVAYRDGGLIVQRKRRLATGHLLFSDPYSIDVGVLGSLESERLYQNDAVMVALVDAVARVKGV